jgi:hypothetical protein
VYLGITGIFGYALLKVTEPSAEKRNQIATTVSKDDRSKNAEFMRVLQEAANSSEPIYAKKQSK